MYAPEFFVLYNGKEPLKNWSYTKKLSEMYGAENVNINLELIVNIFDINSKEFKKKLKENSTLSQYITAVDTLHECIYDNGDLGECINDLINNDVLTNYLKTHATEVTNMLIFDFDYEEELKAEKAEIREECMEEGRKEGIKEGIKEGRKEEKLSLAKALVKLGELTFEKISTVSGLSLETIKEIAKEV